jgi:[protein-PII] uridylyltransferase
VASLREELEKARQNIRTNHRKTPGLRLAHLYAYSVEQLLVRHVEAVAERMNAQHLKEDLSLVAVGGFGRLELCMYSDMDFLFITEREPTPEEEDFMRAVIRPLFDLRMELGYGIHSIKQALGFLGNDPSKVTALLALRHVWGSESLTEELQERLHAKLHKQHKLWFVRAIEEELRDRHSKHGDTVFLLEPDLKLSPGGLRDIHQILWIAFASYGVMSLEVLVENGMLSETEMARLNEAWSFLIEARNTLHILMNRRVDKLTLERQLKVSHEMEYEQTDFALPEEQLMRAYYDQAMTVQRINQRLLRTMLEQTPGTDESSKAATQPRSVDRDFMTRGQEMWFEDRDLVRLDRDRFWQMRFFVGAAREGLEPREDALRRIEERLETVDDSYRKSKVARDLFMTLMRTPGRLAETLRAMHHCGFLDAYIPEFTLVRYLPRIDHYHQFTVDEHLIRSVAIAEALLSDNPPSGMEHVAEVAREMLRVDLLFLSLLLHDVGKGEGRAHVIRGMHIAQRVAERLSLRPVEQDILRNLVANHQKMSHMALRRDIEDPGLVKELAQAVNDPEQLRMLYVHTACDMRAVSDESWNDWRARLLGLLFERTHDHLRGVRREKEQRIPIRDLRDQIWDELQKTEAAGRFDKGDIDHFLTDMPPRYLNSTTAQQAVHHFLLSSKLSNENRISFRLDSYEDSRLLELTFVARTAPGLFASLCGAMAAKRFNIQFAQIYTARSGEAVDIFQVDVPQVLRAGVEEVLGKICDRMNHMLKTGQRQRWTDVIDRTSVLLTENRLKLRPPQVDVDNEMSPQATVIKVSAPDRPGLLSEIAGVFDKFSINIDTAYIATESYQVVDTFYVTDLETNKLNDEGKLKLLHEELLNTITAPLTKAT